jgi:hypothetical protein
MPNAVRILPNGVGHITLQNGGEYGSPGSLLSLDFSHPSSTDPLTYPAIKITSGATPQLDFVDGTYTNHIAVVAKSFATPTNLLGGTLTALSINFAYGSGESTWSTNGPPVFGGYTGLSTTNYCHWLVHLVGGSGSAQPITVPANTAVYGSAYQTNKTDGWFNYDPSVPETNVFFVPKS